MVSELQKEKNFWEFFAKNSMNGDIAQWKVLDELQREARNFQELLKVMKLEQEKKIKQNEVLIKQIVPLIKDVKKDIFNEFKGRKKKDG